MEVNIQPTEVWENVRDTVIWEMVDENGDIGVRYVANISMENQVKINS
jgi:hypothetical protein